MANYRIIIEKIEEQTVMEDAYISDAELRAAGEIRDRESNYRKVAVQKNLSSEIYRQVVEGDINLPAIITAFNGTEERPR